MKTYKVGDRWIWKEDSVSFSPKGELIIISDGIILKGIITEVKSPNSIIIKWENGKSIQYSDYMIELEPRLQIDKQYYRNQKLESLGI